MHSVRDDCSDFLPIWTSTNLKRNWPFQTLQVFDMAIFPRNCVHLCILGSENEYWHMTAWLKFYQITALKPENLWYRLKLCQKWCMLLEKVACSLLGLKSEDKHGLSPLRLVENAWNHKIQEKLWAKMVIFTWLIFPMSSVLFCLCLVVLHILGPLQFKVI